MTRIFHWIFMWWKMDPKSGFDIRLVFTLPPSDSTLQYKRCVHFWNNFPCIKSLYKTITMHILYWNQKESQRLENSDSTKTKTMQKKHQSIFSSLCHFGSNFGSWTSALIWSYWAICVLEIQGFCYRYR